MAGLAFLLVWAWHMPAAHELGCQLSVGFAPDQGSFLMAGLFVWVGCLRGAAKGEAGLSFGRRGPSARALSLRKVPV